ncbi:hypothetical protein JJV70_10705 [Streptomyces sp. JJ66]|uniref:hypothetical protein n=1 Tax=Streptomyces sp. JJ66 TaxID=2803843 RepID=UPI001C576794|nr:hypothetical protein [Streptomyces sp. JJ66]MBW1602567.1 hypothetical protein [Streptomyces sp. JJ66]
MRIRARGAGAAVAVAAALLISGCGSGGDDAEDKPDTSESSSAPADGDTGGDGDGGGDGDTGGDGGAGSGDGGSGDGGDEGQDETGGDGGAGKGADGGSGDDGADGGRDEGADGGGDGDPGEPSTAMKPFQGAWLSAMPGTDAQGIVMVNITDNLIGVADQTLCSGTVDESKKPLTATLKCEGEGGEKYTKATINGVKDGKLSITWASGGAEEYLSAQKMDGAPSFDQ